MRKLLLLVGFAFFLSCAKQETPEILDSQLKKVEEMRNIVDLAIQSKIDFYGADQFTKSIEECDILIVTGESNDTTAFLVNFPQDGGFSLISNSPRREILAVSDRGNLDMDNIVDPAIEIVLQNALSVGEVDDVGPLPFIWVDVQRDTSIYEVQPLIPVDWNQTGHFGSLAPNGVAGCGPVAIAQAMSACEYPEYVEFNYPGHDVNSTFMDWANMNTHLGDHYSGCQYCTAQARLLREIGNRGGANYISEPDGARTSMTPTLSLLHSFGLFGQETTNGSATRIMDSLDDGSPVIIIAQNDLVGHAWNADGYKLYIYTTVTLFSNREPPTPFLMKSGAISRRMEQQTIDGYIHYNYGFGGFNNMYALSYRFFYNNDGLGNITRQVLKNSFSDDYYPQLIKLILDIRPEN